MKTIIKTGIGIGLVCCLSYSCNKEDKLDYTLQNYDTFEPGEIDNWIALNLTDPYNIEVVYRYQRNMHDINKNIAPPDESKVIPQMEVMKNAFLEVYGKVGGETFIKTYTPKQFALFGSGDYDPDGSVKAGTADGGRRITLYGLNGLDVTNPNSVLGNLQVVHHEFTHIINQTRMIPPDFEQVCVGDYYSNWTAQENTPALAMSLGFITPYARKNVGEDFAETLSHLVVAGQLYYDDYAYRSGEEAYPKLKAKESIARDYMMQYFNIDLTQLQMEFQRVMEEQYGSDAFTFVSAVNSNYLGALNWDIRSDWALSKGVSSKQQVLMTSILDELGGWTTKSIQFRFVSSTKATLYITFGDNNNTYGASYDFTIAQEDDGAFKIFKSETQGTDATYSNANIDWVLQDVQPLIDYLGSTSFILDWDAPVSTVSAQDYLKYGVFKDVNDSDAKLIGQVILRKY